MALIEEACALCEVTYPYYSLYRCFGCGRLYCRNCFLYDVDGNIICLKCAKKRVSPKGPSSKYTYLSTYLAQRAKYSDQVTLSFSKIEEIIGEQLPFSAYHYEHWWSNTRNRSHSEAWLTVGWRVQSVDLGRKEVSFKRVEHKMIRVAEKRQRRKPVSAAFKALALKHKPRRLLGPSRTRLAQTQARLENIKQRESTIRTYKGKFKPKKAYEKRLYKPAEKPD